MTELAFEPSGYSKLQTPARNPWNADFITGGSSSGSAVAVASGSAFFALGSDTGGSVRIPAHACGLTAWKPTVGRVSTQGAMALAPTLDTIGILARSAADLVAPAAVLSNDRSEPGPIARVVVLADVLAAAEQTVRHACEAGVEAVAAAAIKIARRDASAAFHQGLNEVSIVEGRNVRIEYRWANNQYLLVEVLKDCRRSRADVGRTVDGRALRWCARLERCRPARNRKHVVTLVPLGRSQSGSGRRVGSDCGRLHHGFRRQHGGSGAS